MTLEEELQVAQGNSLRLVSSRMKGTLGQTEVEEYEEVSLDGQVVAKYTVTVVTNLRTLKTSRSIQKH